MRTFPRVAFILGLVLGLAGCYRIVATPDIATAAVYGPHVPIRPLTPQQVARLSSWMKGHDAGWRSSTQTPYMPTIMRIVIRDPGGQQSRLDLLEAKDGMATLLLYAPAPAAPLKRYLSDADAKALWDAVAN
jgi:hypothetical protein